MLSLLPLAARMGGPKEALLHALIRKNYGCTHIIIGRDHAGPGFNSDGKPFYGIYDAQKLLEKYKDEIRIEMEKFESMVYVPEKRAYLSISEVKKSKNKIKHLTLSELSLEVFWTKEGVFLNGLPIMQ